MLRECVIANVLFLALSASAVWAQPRCIRPAEGVPGTVLSGLPPNWWDQSLLFPRYDTRVDAPSWQGATAHSHPFGGNGTVEDVQFRAAHRSGFLYLSWSVKVVPDLNQLGKNAVWFGFQTAGGANRAVALKIMLDRNTAESAAPLTTGTSGKHLVVFDGSSWGPYTPGVGAEQFPPWILRESGTPNATTDNTARVWIQPGTATTPNKWAVNIRLPLSVTATTSNLDSGVPMSGTEFKFWYELRVSTPGDPKGYKTHRWPVSIPEIVDDVGGAPPPPSAWDTFRLTDADSWDPPDPACLADGVALRGQDIGSDHPSGSTYISLTNSNVFHARPFNHDTTNEAKKLKGRFRIANWGTGPTREDVPNPTTTLWQDIADPNGVPQPDGINILPSTQGTITTSYAVTDPCMRCRYKVFYTVPANKTSCDNNCSATTNNTRDTHQCILVELTGVGVNFLNNSAWQNMNFATTSTFSEPAEINIKELPGLAGGKDVYLYLRAVNMPAKTKPGTPGIGPLPIPGWPPPADALPEGDTPDDDRPRGRDGADVPRVPEPGPDIPARSQQLISALGTALALNQIDYDQLSQSMPTLTVHAYYDTGLRNTTGGGSVAILRPLTSYGYFVVHDGHVGGWKYALQGAQLIAPNWYKVAVGPSGLATVTTVIESLERQSFSAGVRLGLGLPHGSLGNSWDPGFSFDADLEYAVSGTFAVQAILGYNRFGSSTTSDSLGVTRVSVNPKVYVGAGTTRAFFNAGVGFYSFDPGSTEFGLNVGAGVQRDLSATLGLEAAYNYHLVDVPDGSAAFSTIEAGVRLRF